MAGVGDGECRIGVAMDYSASSKRMLDWAIKNLLRRGDTLVVLHALPHGGEEAKHALASKCGSSLIPLSEFRELAVLQNYSVRCDAEVLDMLNTAARQLEGQKQQEELNALRRKHKGDIAVILNGMPAEHREETLTRCRLKAGQKNVRQTSE